MTQIAIGSIGRIGRRITWRHLARIALCLAVAGPVLYLLSQELGRMDGARIAEALGRIPVSALVSSAALTAISLFAVARYDLLALGQLGAQPLQLFLGQRAHLRIAQHLLGLCNRVHNRLIAPDFLDHRPQLGIFAPQLRNVALAHGHLRLDEFETLQNLDHAVLRYHATDLSHPWGMVKTASCATIDACDVYRPPC